MLFRSLARINKWVFNPREIRRGTRPVLTHVGRSSGTTYRTPLDAHPLHDGYLFIPMYGPRTDWVKNVLAAGTARLSLRGEEIELESPLAYFPSLTTFMACMALLLFGGVVLKDFSLALAVGIVIGTYSSVFVASPIIAIWRGEKMVRVKR